MNIISETLTDEIALQLSKGKALTKKSFLRWGDKNRLTRSIESLYLSERGIAIDKLAKNITSEPQFERYEESDVIESIVNFLYDYPNRKALNAYISLRKKEQTSPKIKKQTVLPFAEDDEKCLLKSLRKELTDKEIIDEMTDFSQDPKEYFGKLLVTTTCKKDLFDQTISQQINIAIDILKKLKVTPKKLTKKKKQISLQAGLRKLAGWIQDLK